MGKADKMVERNKKVSRAKAESVCKEIERMLADKERISPQELVRRTGVSRGFLYKNPVVSERMRQARIRQMDGQFIPVQKTILDKGIMPSEKVLDFPVDCNTLTGSVNL